jgi:hypothetical protein
MNYFYDKQIRKYLQQFMRFFAGFSVQMGLDANSNPVYQTVPVRYGDSSRMAATILKNNSENTLNTVPFIAAYINDLTLSPDRRTNPTHQEQIQVFEKKFDEVTGRYLNEAGNTYSVHRYMPIPYDLELKVDIWTSNTDQKLQLLEQILVLFNPSIDLRTNDNIFDWSRINYIELTGTTWSTRSIPSGTEDALEVASLTFKVPIWINPPALVTRQQLIYNVITTIRTGATDELDMLLDDAYISNVNTSWQTVTNPERAVRIVNGEVQLLTRLHDSEINGEVLTWEKELEPYGGLRSGISQIRFNLGEHPGTRYGSIEVIGTLSTHPVDPNKLLVTVDQDSLSHNTLNPVLGIIDPQRMAPGLGLPPASIGQRYIVVKSPAEQWEGLIANPEDIIEYNGTSWIVSFDSQSVTTVEYVLNSASGQQLVYMDGQWILSYEGIFQPGYWRLMV